MPPLGNWRACPSKPPHQRLKALGNLLLAPSAVGEMTAKPALAQGARRVSVAQPLPPGSGRRRSRMPWHPGAQNARCSQHRAEHRQGILPQAAREWCGGAGCPAGSRRHRANTAPASPGSPAPRLRSRAAGCSRSFRSMLRRSMFAEPIRATRRSGTSVLACSSPPPEFEDADAGGQQLGVMRPAESRRPPRNRCGRAGSARSRHRVGRRRRGRDQRRVRHEIRVETTTSRTAPPSRATKTSDIAPFGEFGPGRRRWPGSPPPPRRQRDEGRVRSSPVSAIHRWRREAGSAATTGPSTTASMMSTPGREARLDAEFRIGAVSGLPQKARRLSMTAILRWFAGRCGCRGWPAARAPPAARCAGARRPPGIACQCGDFTSRRDPMPSAMMRQVTPRRAARRTASPPSAVGIGQPDVEGEMDRAPRAVHGLDEPPRWRALEIGGEAGAVAAHHRRLGERLAEAEGGADRSGMASGSIAAAAQAVCALRPRRPVGSDGPPRSRRARRGSPTTDTADAGTRQQPAGPSSQAAREIVSRPSTSRARRMSSRWTTAKTPPAGHGGHPT